MRYHLDAIAVLLRVVEDERNFEHWCLKATDDSLRLAA